MNSLFDSVKDRQRVTTRIGSAVLDFCRAQFGHGDFHIEELRRFITDKCQVAPASPDRILRDLRQRGAVSYVVVSRSKSLYRVTGVSA